MFLKKDGKDVALAACDVYRPAAVDQLVTVGERAGAHVYQQGTETTRSTSPSGRCSRPAPSAATS